MKNKSLLLVYDDLCPLCTWYTSWFVKTGLLSPEGRKAFSTVKESILRKIDFERSKNEIPLVNLQTNQVWYGIDALLEILNQKIPFIKGIGSIPPVKWFLLKLYKLISLNRKVIVARKCGSGSIDCAPEFNFFYRVLFMCLFLFINTWMLFPVHKFILSKLPYYHVEIGELQLAHLAFVFSNILIAFTLPPKDAMEYLGQVNMLAILAIFLLTPLMLLASLFENSTWIINIYLFLLTIQIIREYLRRMEYTGTIRKFKFVAAANFICLAFFLGYLFTLS